MVTKLNQLVKLVQESHAQPITGEVREVEVVGEGETGLTFIGHSSFLLQMGGRNVLVDPVFATRLVVLRRQRWPGLAMKELPAIDVVLITHAHMDHLNLPSLRRVVSAAKRLRGTAPEIVVPRGVEDLVERLGFAASAWDGVVGGASGAGAASDDDSVQALGRADVQGYA